MYFFSSAVWAGPGWAKPTDIEAENKVVRYNAAQTKDGALMMTLNYQREERFRFQDFRMKSANGVVDQFWNQL